MKSLGWRYDNLKTKYEEITSTIFPAFSLISLKFEETVSKFEGSKEILTHQSITH